MTIPIQWISSRFIWQSCRRVLLLRWFSRRCTETHLEWKDDGDDRVCRTTVNLYLDQDDWEQSSVCRHHVNVLYSPLDLNRTSIGNQENSDRVELTQQILPDPQYECSFLTIHFRVYESEEDLYPRKKNLIVTYRSHPCRISATKEKFTLWSWLIIQQWYLLRVLGPRLQLLALDMYWSDFHIEQGTVLEQKKISVDSCFSRIYPNTQSLPYWDRRELVYSTGHIIVCTKSIDTSTHHVLFSRNEQRTDPFGKQWILEENSKSFTPRYQRNSKGRYKRPCDRKEESRTLLRSDLWCNVVRWIRSISSASYASNSIELIS